MLFIYDLCGVFITKLKKIFFKYLIDGLNFY